MSLYDVKPKFRQLLMPAADRLRRVPPDAITMAGVLASIVALGCIAGSIAHRWLLLLVPVWLAVRISCNALDGLVAHRAGRARPFGEVVNEGADRLADLILLLGLGLTAWASLPIAAVASVAVLLASYTGLIGKSVGSGREHGGILGKADRMVWLGLTALVAWHVGPAPVTVGGRQWTSVFELMLGLFVPLSLVTAAQRVARIHAHLRISGGPDA